MQLIRMGILDGREGYDMLMAVLTRVMRHTAAVMMRLWVKDKGYVFRGFDFWFNPTDGMLG